MLSTFKPFTAPEFLLRVFFWFIIFCCFPHVIISPSIKLCPPAASGLVRGIPVNLADVGEWRQRRRGLTSAGATKGSCGEGDCACGQEARATGVGTSPGAARRRAGGGVETVTSAKPTRGQLLAGGKGKQQRKDCGGKRS